MIAQRRERLLALAAGAGVDAVVLRRPYNFAWYTGGADNRVDHTAEAGVAELVISAEAEAVVTTNIEAGRMRDEQTPDVQVHEYPWEKGAGALLQHLSGGGRIGSDLPCDDEADISAGIDALRWTLDVETLADYRAVGAETTAALETVADHARPETTEQAAAAAILAECQRRGLHVAVVLAAGERRLPRYRHPLPGPSPLGRHGMLVVCAERGGLYANLTRMLHFDEPDGALRRRLAACDEILARMREEATRPGRSLAAAFADCRRFYADAGFADGWRDHHQGGLTGYRTREVIAAPDTDVEIRPGQAFAWNPSLPGAKAEETFVLTAAGPERLSG